METSYEQVVEALVGGLEQTCAAISELRQEVGTLKQTVAHLQKRLEDSGALYGGTIAYSNTFVKPTYKTNGVEFE